MSDVLFRNSRTFQGLPVTIQGLFKASCKFGDFSRQLAVKLKDFSQAYEPCRTTVCKFDMRILGHTHTHMACAPCGICLANLPMMFPRAQTACSHTFWCGESNRARKGSTAPGKHKKMLPMPDYIVLL